MPMAFIRDFHTADAITPNGEERRLLKYLKSIQEDATEDITSDYSLTLEVDIKLKKGTSGNELTEVRITNDPTATPVLLAEKDILKKFPWEYKKLLNHLSDRYTDFLQNKRFYSIKRTLEENPNLCRERYLNPGNPRSPMKRFYNPNILKEFDNHYTKKS